MKNLLLTIFLTVFLILIQILILNNIHIGSYATPFLFIWLILRMPNELPRGWLITFSFFVGLIIDLFTNTPGMYALASITLAFFKEPILTLYVTKEDVKVGEASVQTMGLGAYLRFLATTVTLFCATLFIIESFSFFNWKVLFLKIITSSILTFLLIINIGYLKPTNK